MSADSISLALFLNEAWDKVREMGLQGAVDGMFSEKEEDVERERNVTRKHTCGPSACVDLLLFYAVHVQEYSWYRGTSLIRKRLLLGPYSRHTPRALW